ncbi:hypothetical protein EYB25_000999 [Talaromyces marneffei]|nr:hypothetical protein EYB25_000999 [Talaromyces marneffei]
MQDQKRIYFLGSNISHAVSNYMTRSPHPSDTPTGVSKQSTPPTSVTSQKQNYAVPRDSDTTSTNGETKTGFIVGAGGACRAAIYAFTRHLNVTKIYSINRDAKEVQTLLSDISVRYQKTTPPIPMPEIVHLQTPEQARNLKDEPYYGIGTVPDDPPTTEAEIVARDTLRALLDHKDEKKGVFLDMCYKPRETKNLKAAKKCGWVTGEGVDVVSFQLNEQWRLWAGKEASERIPLERMVTRAREIADGFI